MSDPKAPSPALCYLQLYPALREAARSCGYALGLHGSLQRDMDLIAVPWTDEAKHPRDLVDALSVASGLYFVEGWSGPHHMPAGRLGFKLTVGGRCYVDLSVVPPKGGDHE